MKESKYGSFSKDRGLMTKETGVVLMACLWCEQFKAIQSLGTTRGISLLNLLASDRSITRFTGHLSRIPLRGVLGRVIVSLRERIDY